MSHNANADNPNAWTDAEKDSLKQLVRYAVWIIGAIVVALVIAAVLASVFNLEAGVGKATSSDLTGTPPAMVLPS